MKLDPIKNPHSKTAKIEKKTKFEEKEDLIEKTKKVTLDKYGVMFDVNSGRKRQWAKNTRRSLQLWLVQLNR